MLDQPYSPMTIRFFILQAHYRSSMDFSNDALKASEKGLQKLMNAITLTDKLKASPESTIDVNSLRGKCYDAMNDDLNTPGLLSCLFEGVRYINSVNDGTETVSAEGLEILKSIFRTFVYDILGLKDETETKEDDGLKEKLMKIIIGLRQEARDNKDFKTSDKIRDELKKAGITLKDRKEGVDWEIE